MGEREGCYALSVGSSLTQHGERLGRKEEEEGGITVVVWDSDWT